MPPPLVPKRVEDIIFYYYAKLVIGPSSGFAKNYRFIVDAYKKLKAGQLRMSDYDRELHRLAHEPGICAYCGNRSPKTVPSQLVPTELGGPIGIQNQVLACPKCATSKEGRDLVEWWEDELGKHHDTLPRVPTGLYLKMAYEIHTVNFTLKARCSGLSGLFDSKSQ